MKATTFVLIVLTQFFVFAMNGQDSDQNIGNKTYGMYLDRSTFIELTLNYDSTFSYYDQFELGSTYVCIGNWKLKGRKLILYNFIHETTGSMPTRWKIRKEKLIGSKITYFRTGRSIQIVLL